MANYNNENLLEMVELYADEMGYISSEDELSERFDAEIMPDILAQYAKPGEEFEDQDTINEAFNNWTDSLCKEGEIHPEQYARYTYTGKYSN